MAAEAVQFKRAVLLLSDAVQTVKKSPQEVDVSDQPR